MSSTTDDDKKEPFEVYPYSKASPNVFVSDLYPRVKIPLLWYLEAEKDLKEIEEKSRDGMSKIMARNSLKKLQSLRLKYCSVPKEVL
jgi:hypothetical protein